MIYYQAHRDTQLWLCKIVSLKRRLRLFLSLVESTPCLGAVKSPLPEKTQPQAHNKIKSKFFGFGINSKQEVFLKILGKGTPRALSSLAISSPFLQVENLCYISTAFRNRSINIIYCLCCSRTYGPESHCASTVQTQDYLCPNLNIR